MAGELHPIDKVQLDHALDQISADQHGSHRNNTPTPSRSRLLRIQEPERAARDVLLSSTKETIGSAGNCTVRLHGPHIHPIHCLVLQGANGNVVRCWDPDARLNGQPFADALLKPGDFLLLGSVNVEVLEEQLPPKIPDTSRLPASPEQEELVQSLRRQIARLQSDVSSHDREGRAWKSAAETLYRQYDAQQSAIRHEQAQCLEERKRFEEEIRQSRKTTEAAVRIQNDYDERIHKLRQDEQSVTQRSADLKHRRRDVENVRRALEDEREAWLRARQQVEADEETLRNKLREELESERAHVESSQQELNAERLAWNAECEQRQRDRDQWTEEAATLDARRAEFSAGQEASTKEINAIRAAHNKTVEREHKQLTQSRAKFEAERERFELQHAQWLVECEQQATQQIEFRSQQTEFAGQQDHAAAEYAQREDE